MIKKVLKQKSGKDQQAQYPSPEEFQVMLEKRLPGSKQPLKREKVLNYYRSHVLVLLPVLRSRYCIHTVICACFFVFRVPVRELARHVSLHSCVSVSFESLSCVDRD